MSTANARTLMLLLLAAGGEMGCDSGRARPAPTPQDNDSQPAEAPAAHPSPTGEVTPRTVYVPAYSQLATGHREETLFSITLSIRNVDPSATVRLTQVEYYDTAGHRLRRYLPETRSLGPLETAEFSVETRDDSGGSGANFLVYWEGPSDAHALMTETIMIGFVGSGYVAFTSRGVQLDRPPAEEQRDPSSPEPDVSDGSESPEEGAGGERPNEAVPAR